jgi:hypothetical protein
MSFDPVAHDAAGLQHFAKVKKAEGGQPARALTTAASWLEKAAALGLGIADEASLDIIEVNLT